MINTTIHVVPVSSDQPPVALFTFSPCNTTTGQSVEFFGGPSYDPDGYIQTWFWSFGDGFTGVGQVVFHSYNTAGTFTVTLTVADNAGLTATTTAVISIRGNKAPVASFVFSPPSPRAGQTVSFNGRSSFDPYGYLQTYFWSCGNRRRFHISGA